MNRPDNPRKTYIAIAARQFADQGYHGTSLASLAKDAGVTKQALLHFFQTKERLYEEVLSDLAHRLLADIKAAYHPDPARHLFLYFQEFRAGALTEAEDVRLVVRALLDSDPAARKWPLKPYLDMLIQLACATEGGQHATQDEALAWLAQMIGTIQYTAISAPAVSGMYGQATAAGIADRSERIVAQAIEHFVGKMSGSEENAPLG